MRASQTGNKVDQVSKLRHRDQGKIVLWPLVKIRTVNTTENKQTNPNITNANVNADCEC